MSQISKADDSALTNAVAGLLLKRLVLSAEVIGKGVCMGGRGLGSKFGMSFCLLFNARQSGLGSVCGDMRRPMSRRRWAPCRAATP